MPVSFNSVSLYFTYYVALLLAAYTFRIAVTAQVDRHFIAMQCPSLIIFSALKYILYEITIAILVFF